jgi:hypothetical protein
MNKWTVWNPVVLGFCFYFVKVMTSYKLKFSDDWLVLFVSYWLQFGAGHCKISKDVKYCMIKNLKQMGWGRVGCVLFCFLFFLFFFFLMFWFPCLSVGGLWNFFYL